MSAVLIPNEIRGAENKIIRGVGAGWKGTTMERFWKKVVLDPGSGCLEWVGAIGTSGYGHFRAPDGRTRHASRWLWETMEGPVPEGMELDHLCRNRACVNLLHLEPVTPSVNQRRGLAPALTRARAASLTHCRRGHEFTPENTYREKVTGSRHCRACHRECQRKRRIAQRAAA